MLLPGRIVSPIEKVTWRLRGQSAAVWPFGKAKMLLTMTVLGSWLEMSGKGSDLVFEFYLSMLIGLCFDVLSYIINIYIYLKLRMSHVPWVKEKGQLRKLISASKSTWSPSRNMQNMPKRFACFFKMQIPIKSQTHIAVFGKTHDQIKPKGRLTTPFAANPRDHTRLQAASQDVPMNRW